MRIPFTKFEFKLRKADPDSIEINKDVLEQFIGTNERFKGARPMMDPKSTVGDEQILIPVHPIPLDIIADVAKYSDVLRTIHQNLRKEIFRKGYDVQENFSVKCAACGKEFKNVQTECDECKGVELREPDIEQRKKLTKYLKEVNDNQQDIINVYEELNDDLETFDDAYMLCVNDYYHTGDGELIASIPVEFLRTDPKWIRIIADKKGRPARNQNGDVLYFCPDHRNELLFNRDSCNICEKKTFLANYRGEEPEGKYIYYSKDEIMHKSKYNPSLTYGSSVIPAIWMKVVTLMNMDLYMKNYYSKQRPPRGLLFVNTPNITSLQKAWNWMLDQWKQNPHQIPPIAVEQVAGSKGNLVQFIDLMRSMDEMQFIEARNEYRRTIGAVYGVMPLFQADISTSGGLNNEGLQITITNRAIKDGQGIYDDGFSPWVCERLGITDYSFPLAPNEEQDLMHKEELKAKKIENATRMQDMGFEVTLSEDEEFEYDPIDEAVSKPEGSFGLGGFGQSGGLPPLPGANRLPSQTSGDAKPPAPKYEGAPGNTKFGKSAGYDQRFTKIQKKTSAEELIEKNKKEYETETEIINNNKKNSPEAKKRHKFKAAKWTHPNGHPRCITCGDEETMDGYCEGGK